MSITNLWIRLPGRQLKFGGDGRAAVSGRGRLRGRSPRRGRGRRGRRRGTAPRLGRRGRARARQMAVVELVLLQFLLVEVQLEFGLKLRKVMNGKFLSSCMNSLCRFR